MAEFIKEITNKHYSEAELITLVVAWEELPLLLGNISPRGNPAIFLWEAEK